MLFFAYIQLLGVLLLFCFTEGHRMFFVWFWFLLWDICDLSSIYIFVKIKKKSFLKNKIFSILILISPSEYTLLFNTESINVIIEDNDWSVKQTALKRLDWYYYICIYYAF